MAEIEKGFDELSAQTTEMSSHVSNAGKLLFCPNPHTFTQARDALTLQFFCRQTSKADAPCGTCI